MRGCVHACECACAGPPTGLGEARANLKIGTPHNGLCEGGLGARPQEILRFYML